MALPVSVIQPPDLATLQTATKTEIRSLSLPTCSVIIPAYNSLPNLIETLNRVAASVDFSRTEILIQDDASPEYDLTRLVGNPPFKVERNPDNLGFIKNVNKAAHRAIGDYICLLNQDCRPLVIDWLDRMLTLITTIPNAGIVGPKLVFPEAMGGGIQSCGGLFDAGKGPYHRYLGWKDISDWRVNTTEPVSWITGACLLISRTDFWKCGGLDDIHFVGGYFEDVSLCMQVRLELGKTVWYCAESVMEHSVGSTGGSKHFKQNSLAFHALWNDKIIPDSSMVYVDY